MCLILQFSTGYHTNSFFETALHFHAALAKCLFQRFSMFQDFLEKSIDEFNSGFEARWHSDPEEARLIFQVIQKEFYSSSLSSKICMVSSKATCLPKCLNV